MFWIPHAFLLLGAQLLAQPPVDSPNRYERVMAIMPMIGSGTKAAPFRPEYAPAGKRGGRDMSRRKCGVVPPHPTASER